MKAFHARIAVRAMRVRAAAGPLMTSSSPPPRPVPLSERPPNSIIQLRDLLAFHATALAEIRSLGDSLERKDNGPSAAQLARELEWLLEDSVVASSPALGAIVQPTAARAHTAAMPAPAAAQQQHQAARTNAAMVAAGASSRGPGSDPLPSSPSPSPYSSYEGERAVGWRRTTWPGLKAEAAGVAGARRTDALGLGSPEAPPLEVLARLPLSCLRQLWRRRLDDRVPIQYLTNQSSWRDLVLAVTPGVLIPRPETETLVDLAADFIRASPEMAGEGRPWVDLGTGTGALAVGIARLLPAPTPLYAVDLNPLAVDLAQWNAERLLPDGAARVRAVEGSWFEPIEHLKGQLGGIVSNPPYIPRRNLSGLQEEVRRHEPLMALDGGAGGDGAQEGGECLRVICEGAREHLAPGGWIGLETDGPSQARWVASFLSSLGFSSVSVVADCYGVERMVTGVRRA